jgi:hypothetical protein
MPDSPGMPLIGPSPRLALDFIHYPFGRRGVTVRYQPGQAQG